jgi:hypothetical protein
MKKTCLNIILMPTFLFFLIGSGLAFGWHDKTHLAISKAAGYDCWYNSAGPDITKTKADDKEATNHWFNNIAGVDVTEKMVLDQASRYNNPNDEEGHLYGAIIASLREYTMSKEPDKYAEYHMAFCSHYIGDLSMPLHNIPYGDNKFNNKKRHTDNDGVVEWSALNNIGLIQKYMYKIEIKSEGDLAREIARIANLSRQLACKMEKENRNMEQDEAYMQLSHSASLLKAVLMFAAERKQ